MAEQIPKDAPPTDCQARFSGRARNVDVRKYSQCIDCNLRRRGLCPNGDNLPYEVEGKIFDAKTAEEFNAIALEADNISLMRVQDMCQRTKRNMLN